MSKTIKEWLSELDSPYREQALENMDKDIPYTGDRKVESIKGALSGAFMWHETPEGYNYWRHLCHSL